jgi:hypothetical protein
VHLYIEVNQAYQDFGELAEKHGTSFISLERTKADTDIIIILSLLFNL